MLCFMELRIAVDHFCLNKKRFYIYKLRSQGRPFTAAIVRVSKNEGQRNERERGSSTTEQPHDTVIDFLKEEFNP